MRLPFLLLCLLLVPPAQAAPAAPEIGVLVERISMALGGARGGARALAQVRELDILFERTVRDSVTRKEWQATHRLVSLDGGKRQRLDLRVTDGTDSASVLDGDAAWLIVDGAVHDLEPGAVESRILEFTPGRLFSVPLALATEGRQILGDADLAVAGRVDEGGRARFILVGTGTDGEESVRLEVDARTYQPLEVAFKSPSGDVVYRYGDYREIAKAVVLPFERQFLRNGILVSTTKIERLKLSVPDADALFDRARTELTQLDRGGGKSP